MDYQVQPGDYILICTRIAPGYFKTIEKVSAVEIHRLRTMTLLGKPNAWGLRSSFIKIPGPFLTEDQKTALIGLACPTI